MDSFKYLGFTFNRQGDYKQQIKELKIKGLAAARSVWGIGERFFRHDYNRRMWIFNTLVRSVLEYGVEIWGWEERKELEKIKLDYVRWIYKLEFCTPRYIMEKELELRRMKTRWGIRAMKYEEKIRRRGEEKLTRQCWEEKQKEKDSRKEKIKYLNNLGLSEEMIEIWRSQDRNIVEELERRSHDIEMQTRRSRIEGAKYNTRYKEIMKLGRPRYMDNKELQKYRGIFVKIRCGNFENRNRYWEKEEGKRCSICKGEEGSMEHLIKECGELEKERANLPEYIKENWDIVFREEGNLEVGKFFKKVEKEIEKRRKQDSGKE